jgi:regulator of sigma E protease
MSAPEGARFVRYWRKMENTSLLAGLIFFIAFAGMILLHELGHFLAALWLGIEVEEFGFGIPPRAWVFWRQKGHLLTRSGKRIEIPREFGLPQFGWSEILNQELTLTVDRVEDQLILRTMEVPSNEPAREPSKGGQILVDGNGVVVRPQSARKTVQYGKTRGQEELREVIAETHPGTEFTLNWLPIGGFVRPKGENDPKVPGGLSAASPWKRLGVLFAGPIMNLLTGFLVFVFLVNVDGYHDVTRVQLSAIAPNSPAEAAGMRVNDVVVQAAGQPVTGMEALSGIVKAHLGQPVEFVLQRGEQTLTVTATPRTDPPAGQGAVGIQMSEYILPITTWGDTFRYAAVSVRDQARAMLLLPAQLLRGTLSPQEGRFVGLKGIYDIFNLTVSTDVVSREQTPSSPSQSPTYSTLYLIATLTISIGLINLFPFPALDGGRIIFVLPEMLTRRRVPPQFENAVHAAGMLILLLFMLYINVMDFVNPIILPTP